MIEIPTHLYFLQKTFAYDYDAQRYLISIICVEQLDITRGK